MCPRVTFYDETKTNDDANKSYQRARPMCSGDSTVKIISIYMYRKQSSVCANICFHSSKTTVHTSIILGTVDHHPGVSVIRGFFMPR